MADLKNIRVAVNGYGVIGKRVAAAAARQQDMLSVGVVGCGDRLAGAHGNPERLPLFGATTEYAGRDARGGPGRDWRTSIVRINAAAGIETALM